MGDAGFDGAAFSYFCSRNPCPCNFTKAQWFSKLSFGGICILVCHQFPIRGEYTFVHVSPEAVSNSVLMEGTVSYNALSEAGRK